MKPIRGSAGREYPHTFRDFDADENDPENYDFTFTDKLLEALVEAGACL